MMIKPAAVSAYSLTCGKTAYMVLHRVNIALKFI